LSNTSKDDFNEDVVDQQDAGSSSSLGQDQDPDTGDLSGNTPDDPEQDDGGAAAQRSIVDWLFSGLAGLFSGKSHQAENASAPHASSSGPVPLKRRSRAIEREEEQELLAKMRAKETIEERLERYRQMVEGFEEDRENLLEKAGRWLFLVLAYVAPVVIAWAVGKEIGDAYGGPFSWDDGWSLGVHMGAFFGEQSLAMMSLASATALRRLQSDRGYIAKLALAVFFLVLFSLASGLAQWYIAMNRVNIGATGGYAALIFRVTMPPAVDIASLLYISIMGFKSLQKHLANMKLMANALRDLNDAEIDIRKSQNAAKQQERRENLLMRVESLQADAVIKAVERSLNDQNDKRGNGWQMRA
jgi:hypothetical protein